jgi:uncharacterized protein (DUF1330 family)
MPAYLIAAVSPTNPEAYAEYAKLAGPAIQQHGGRYLVRGGRVETLEGAWPHARTVVVEFATVEQAKALYRSVEYQAARAKRVGAADFNMIVVEGVTPAP